SDLPLFCIIICSRSVSLHTLLLSIPILLLPYSTPIFFFFFNDPAPTEIYTLSLHDALPIFEPFLPVANAELNAEVDPETDKQDRSEEHTSELQSLTNLVCRLLLEKKKKIHKQKTKPRKRAECIRYNKSLTDVIDANTLSDRH